MKKYSSPSCGNNVFSHGYCRFHQQLRKDNKYKPYQYVKKPTGELALFNDIWANRFHFSFLSGRDLNEFGSSDFYINMFAHVLPKAQNKYPRFKLNPDNIILLHPEEHELLDNGTEEEREKYASWYGCSWDKIWKLRDKLIEEYKNETNIYNRI